MIPKRAIELAIEGGFRPEGVPEHWRFVSVELPDSHTFQINYSVPGMGDLGER